MYTNVLISETETDSQTQRTDWRLPRERGVKRTGLRVWDQEIQTDIYRMDKQQGPNYTAQGTIFDIL